MYATTLGKSIGNARARTNKKNKIKTRTVNNHRQTANSRANKYDIIDPASLRTIYSIMYSPTHFTPYGPACFAYHTIYWYIKYVYSVQSSNSNEIFPF